MSRYYIIYLEKKAKIPNYYNGQVKNVLHDRTSTLICVNFWSTITSAIKQKRSNIPRKLSISIPVHLTGN